jgi:hypothetical protein
MKSLTPLSAYHVLRITTEAMNLIDWYRIQSDIQTLALFKKNYFESTSYKFRKFFRRPDPTEEQLYDMLLEEARNSWFATFPSGSYYFERQGCRSLRIVAQEAINHNHSAGESEMMITAEDFEMINSALSKLRPLKQMEVDQEKEAA